MAGHHEDASFSTPASSNWPLSKAWAIGAADRAIKSFVTTLLVLLGGGAVGLNLVHVDWLNALEVSGSTVVLSVLTSVASAFLGETGTTSALPGGK